MIIAGLISDEDEARQIQFMAKIFIVGKMARELAQRLNDDN